MPTQWFSEKDRLIRPVSIYGDDTTNPATLLKILVPKPLRDFESTNTTIGHGDWTFVILFDRNLKVKFTSLEATVSVSKYGKVVTFLPKPFFNHDEANSIIVLNVIAEGINWRHLGTRDCMYL